MRERLRNDTMLELFLIVISAVIIQRVVELIYSASNEKKLLRRGAIEFGKRHYKYIVLMHSLFFISMSAEFFLTSMNDKLNIINYLFLVIFIFLQAGRIWVLISLGEFWNTKILRIPGSTLVNRGPYRFLRHPNYVIVACEMFSLPIIFNLYFTATIFTLLNFLVLRVRINEENKALKI